MSKFQVDEITDAAGTGAPDFSQGASFSAGAVDAFDAELSNMDASDIAFPLNLRKIGDVVFCTLEIDISSTGNKTNTTNPITVNAIASQFRPTSTNNIRNVIAGRDNAANVPIVINVTSGGLISFELTDGSAWSNAGQARIRAFSMSWTV